jgi:hypothetical protein
VRMCVALRLACFFHPTGSMNCQEAVETTILGNCRTHCAAETSKAKENHPDNFSGNRTKGPNAARVETNRTYTGMWLACERISQGQGWTSPQVVHEGVCLIGQRDDCHNSG